MTGDDFNDIPLSLPELMASSTLDTNLNSSHPSPLIKEDKNKAVLGELKIQK